MRYLISQNLLARRRGLVYLFIFLFRGISRGEPVPIAIAGGIILLIVGVAMYKKLSAQ